MRLRQADPDSDGTRFRTGVEQFNAGDYWGAHDTWELIWLASSGERRQFIQGLIQLAGVCIHLERGNERGATRLLAAGLAKLDPLPADYGGIELAELRDASRGLLTASLDEVHALRVRPART